ncbi:kinesin-like protein KIF21B [Ixodes scapularis]|uniref:kinesin-like protein KIF21B n=1 Tax=Ixodes scapularis TaxID=6945 RepID=UPI001C394DD5|nr:kinesin-like protein KIF21B [Ixodes scapularis]
MGRKQASYGERKLKKSLVENTRKRQCVEASHVEVPGEIVPLCSRPDGFVSERSEGGPQAATVRGSPVRPLIPREGIDMCHACTSVASGEPQIWVGKDKAFTFDHVFDCPTHQERVYDTCVKALVEGLNRNLLLQSLEQFRVPRHKMMRMSSNSPIEVHILCEHEIDLWWPFSPSNEMVKKTGSGKTYTMGTGYGLNLDEHERGIIPRAVDQLFAGIARRQAEAREKGAPVPDFKVHVQFMELYNEEIFDLLNSGKDDQGSKSRIKIHEDVKGEIYSIGVTTKTVQNAEQVIKCLESGALSRTTASTAMNVQSSRSHAIFTLHIKQQRVVTLPLLEGAEEEEDSGEALSEFETLMAKFHFVDLAGSERLKRTGATGVRAKEGISINCGLLDLGNVISALGDASGKISHVPYRDSKLTRLLQDSLGGNSRTLMIACVSPCDRDFMETLNTLRYANRAKDIKNKITVNQDKSSQTISLLRREVQDLQLELMEYKQGKRLVGEDGVEQVNDMFYENTMLQTENGNFRTRIKALQETVERLTVKNTELLAEHEAAAWIGRDGSDAGDVKVLIQGYLKEVEELRTKLLDSEEVCGQLRKQLQRSQARLLPSPTTVAVSGVYDVGAEEASVDDVLAQAKRDVECLTRKTKHLSRAQREEEEREKKSDADEGTAEASGNDESSESEVEADEDERYSQDLVNLTMEISCKQKLIKQLEQSQRRLHTTRIHYEEKLVQLQARIRETELERDRILSSVGSAGPSKDWEEKVRKIRGDFERRLGQLQGELKKMQAARREHAQLIKNQAEYERQVRKLKQEVADMKKTKVSLMTKMKEGSRCHQEAEKRRQREVAQMRKENRQQENRIRSLEAQNRTKEMVLKRRHEEVAALRRQAHPMSSRVAGRLGGKSLLVSPRVAKQKWQTLEKNIDKLVLSKQNIYTLERDMERWLMVKQFLGRNKKSKMCPPSRKRGQTI